MYSMLLPVFTILMPLLSDSLNMSWIFADLSQSQLPCIFLLSPQLLLIAPDHLRHCLQTPSQSDKTVCLNSFAIRSMFLLARPNSKFQPHLIFFCYVVSSLLVCQQHLCGFLHLQLLNQNLKTAGASALKSEAGQPSPAVYKRTVVLSLSQDLDI